MSVLLNSGLYFFLAVVKNWLTTEELALFDASLCNENSRRKYLHYLSINTVPFTKTPIRPQIYSYNGSDVYAAKDRLQFYVAWLVSRYIRTSQLVLNGECYTAVVDPTVLSTLEVVCYSHKSLEFFQTLFVGCTKLKELTLSKTKEPLLDQLMECVGINCRQLTAIRLQYITHLSDTNIGFLTFCCRHLKGLQISNCPEITDDGIIQCVTHCTDLRVLNLNNCSDHIANRSIYAIVDKLHTNLTTVDLSSYYRITVDAMTILCSTCTSLTGINISHCYKASTDKLLETIANHLPRLQWLHVSHSADITDDGITILCLGCKLITDLNISNVYELTSVSAVAIGTHLKCLREIQFTECDKFTSQAAITLTEHMLCITKMDLCNGVIIGETCTTYATATEVTESESASTAVDLVELDNDRHDGHSKEPLTDPNLIEQLTIINTMVQSRYTPGRRDAFYALLPKCHRLMELRLSNTSNVCTSINISTFLLLIETCGETLQTLDVSASRGLVTDRELSGVATHCHALTDVSLAYCRRISESGIVQLVRSCPDLLRLNIEGTKVTRKGITLIDSARPTLRRTSAAYREVTQQKK